MSDKTLKFILDPRLRHFKLGEVVVVMSIPERFDQARSIEHIGHVTGFTLGGVTGYGPEVLVKVKIETGEEHVYNIYHLLIPTEDNNVLV